MKLSKREVDDATCPPGQKDKLFFADNPTGFALRVTEKGKKIFVFRYRSGAQVRTLRLGVYDTLTAAQARYLAVKASLEVAAGRDLVADRRASIEADEQAAADAETAAAERAKHDAFTFAALAKRWVTESLKDHRPRYSSEAARALRVNFGKLADRPAPDITQAEAQETLDAVAEKRGPHMARRSHAYARAMYGWAVKRGLLADNPFARVAVEGRESIRDRVLTDAELGEVWRAAGELGWPFKPYLRFLMLTLQRVSETAGLCWAEIDMERKVWTIPASRTKNGKPHLVHLSPPALAILKSLPRIMPAKYDPEDDTEPAPSPLAFTTNGKTAISGFSRAKDRLDQVVAKCRNETAADRNEQPVPVPDWRLHDLRRTGVTALARLGVRWEVADRVLNHVQGAIQGVAAVYQRHEFLDERRQAMDVWADHVLKHGRPEMPALPARKVARSR